MKLKNPMLMVTDIDKSVEFYKKVFGLHVIMDFGANKTLTGGLALQTVETYKDFIGKSDVTCGCCYEHRRFCGWCYLCGVGSKYNYSCFAYRFHCLFIFLHRSKNRLYIW